jgi:hypothetical protein
MGAGDDILRALDGLRRHLDTLERKIDWIADHVDRPAAPQGNGSNGGGKVAATSQIQGERGNPKVRMDPRDWPGEKCKGRLANECPPDFLDIYADQLDWFADNPKEGADPKKSQWDRLDAARCRRWAIEIREGRHKPGERPVTRLAPPPGEDTSGTTWTSGNLAPPPTGMAPPPSDDTGGLLPPPPDDGADPYDDSMPF